MADILNANSSYASGTNDTASTATDGVTLHASKNINGALSACVDIETILGTGTTLKGSMTDLVARLAVGISGAGVLDVNDATAFPGPLNVARGGSGASSLTDGGILLGSGTGAITALGVATNGQIPIGDGSTDPVLATITGTANEITVTNSTGSITLSIPDSATLVTPLISGAAPATPAADTIYSDSIIKGWCVWQIDGTVDDDLNVSSVTEVAIGQWAINWARAFATGNYGVMACTQTSRGDEHLAIDHGTDPTTTVLRMRTIDSSGTTADPPGTRVRMYAAAIGNQ